MTQAEWVDGGLRIQQGEGANHFSVGVERDRWRTFAATGLTSGFAFSNSKVYLGAGFQMDASGNYRRQESGALPTITQAQYSNRISMREVAALGRELDMRTSGSYNLRNIPIMRIGDMLDRYPAFLKPDHLNQLREFLADASNSARRIEAARTELHRIVSTEPEMQNIPNRSAMLVRLSEPVTSASIQALTLQDIDNALQKVLIQPNGVAALAQRIAQEVDQGLVKLDQMLGEESLNTKLSDRHRQQIHAAVEKLVQQGQEMRQKMEDDLPTAKEVKRVADISRRAMEWDPAVEVSSYATLARESAPMRLGSQSLRTVLGASYELGRRVDVDNIWAIRNGEHTDVKFIPSHIQNRTVFVGLGTDTYNAMPTLTAHQLGIKPSQEQSGAGVYAALRQSTEKLFGAKVNDITSAELMGKMHYKLGQGDVLSVEAGASCPIKPSDTPCAKQVRLGRTF